MKGFLRGAGIFLTCVLFAAATVYIFREDIMVAISRPIDGFDPANVPDAPDYADETAWLILPDDGESATRTAVFYLHPTSHYDRRGWNAAIDDGMSRWWLENSILPSQTVAFEECCRVFAPAYRQASAHAFLQPGDNAYAALHLAYNDVRRAFAAFLNRLDADEPFLIAGHSQGSLHGQRLLTDPAYRDLLGERLVAAYLIGYSARRNVFDGAAGFVRECDAPETTGCLITWMSMRRNGNPSRWTRDVPVWTGRQYEPSGGWPVHCVNPLSWRADERRMPAENHRGARLRLIGDGTVRGGLTSAQCRDGILRIDDTGEPGIAFFMFQGGDFHPIEYSLFYADIAANAATRIAAWHRR